LTTRRGKGSRPTHSGINQLGASKARKRREKREDVEKEKGKIGKRGEYGNNEEKNRKREKSRVQPPRKGRLLRNEIFFYKKDSSLGDQSSAGRMKITLEKETSNTLFGGNKRDKLQTRASGGCVKGKTRMPARERYDKRTRAAGAFRCQGWRKTLEENGEYRKKTKTSGSQDRRFNNMCTKLEKGEKRGS